MKQKTVTELLYILRRCLRSPEQSEETFHKKLYVLHIPVQIGILDPSGKFHLQLGRGLRKNIRLIPIGSRFIKALF